MWTWAAAAVRGTSHERTGIPRQDAFRCLAANDGANLIAIVCDGAGSASHGGQGATLASRRLSQSLVAYLRSSGGLPDDSLVSEWIDETRDQIGEVARRYNLAPRDFATTLVIAAVTPTCSLCVHVGDGAAVGRSRETGEWIALSWPEHGEYASTTFFLTDEPEARVRISRSEVALDRVAVMTDGIERLALNFTDLSPYAPFFEGVSRPVAASAAPGLDIELSRKLADYLSSGVINARTDDDKTLILATLP
jgi:hypothetical protein